jgi:sulfatase modifying factor 1
VNCKISRSQELVIGIWLFAVCALASSGLSACSKAPKAIEITAPGAAPPGMVWVPGGEFLMGDEGEYSSDAEKPVHRVRIGGVFMDAHTVTVAEFAEFVGATHYVSVAEKAPTAEEILRQMPAGTPSPDPALLVKGSLVFKPSADVTDLRNWSQWWTFTPGADWRHPSGPGSSIDGHDRDPVVQVAWADAVAYANWAGKRLPTEAEWERAARGGLEGKRFAWGDAPIDPAHPQAHIYEGHFPSHAAAPRAVGSFPPNAYGLYDMSGNVWQWTLDWYRPDSYLHDRAQGVVVDPPGPAKGLDPRPDQQPSRVTRGGSFLCSDMYCRGYRVAARSPAAPDSGASHIGFRGVMTVEQWKKWKAAAK